MSGNTREQVLEAIEKINLAWKENRPADLIPLFHPEMTLAFPGFAGKGQGRDAVVAGFKDFCSHAAIHECRETDFYVDIVASTAVATFRYDMVYERDGRRYRSRGRDFWVLQEEDGQWLAIWRTMLDMDEGCISDED